jgi:hypothetical protein
MLRSPAQMSDRGTTDGALETLRQELYWAQAGVRRFRADTVAIRDQLQGFAFRRRTEESRPGLHEDLLASRSASRRVVKTGIWRTLRFVTVRQERLFADLAELTAGLAERLIAAEREIARLRAEVDELRRDRR